MAQSRVFKPVGADQNGNFPDRVRTALGLIFLTTPTGGSIGQALVKQSDGSYAPGNAFAADATTNSKGSIQLAGALGGTAASPTVPGLATKADLINGLIPSGQIPTIAIVDYLGPSANQAAMLALTGQKGDWTTRTDLGTTWLITGNAPTQLSSWTQLSYPVSPVSSVAGRTGAVTLTKTDVGLSNVDNIADTAKPVSTAQSTAIDAARASAIQRANHTGTQPATTITGLSAVATSGSYVDLTNKPTYSTLAMFVEDPDDPGTYIITTPSDTTIHNLTTESGDKFTTEAGVELILET